MTTEQQVEIGETNIAITHYPTLGKTRLNINVPQGEAPGNVLDNPYTVDWLRDIAAAAEGHNRRDDVDPTDTFALINAAKAFAKALEMATRDDVSVAADILKSESTDHAVDGGLRLQLKALAALTRKQLERF